MKENPTYIDLQVVDKWDGFTPLVIGGSDNLVFPLQDLERLRELKSHATNSPAASGKRPVAR